MLNSPSELMKLGNPVGVALRGRLYTYRYIATTVTKDSIPYWDMYPVVLVTRLFQGGFQGLNFNYLKNDMRDDLIKSLSRFFRVRGNLRFFEYKGFLRVLQQRPWRSALVCMRSYRYDNLQTPLIQIYDDEWENVMRSSYEMFFRTNLITKNRVPVKSELIWEQQRLKILKGTNN